MATLKLNKKEIKKIAESGAVDVKTTDPWWVVVLKVLAYVCGLLLAGVATPTVTSGITDVGATFINLM